MFFLSRSYPRRRVFRQVSDWIPACAGMSGILIMLALSACDVGNREVSKEKTNAPVTKRVVEDDKTVAVTPAAHMETITPSAEKIILQDGVDAFLGYQRIEIPESLSGTYPELNKGILAFMLGFNLRAMANEEPVSSWAKIRRSKTGEITWQYELAYLPDDAIYAVDYKVYFAQLEKGYKIARIGHRVKCYRGPNPKQWTVELCP